MRVVRLHLLHLLQTVPNGAVDLDAGVPARGLHGEAYRGHIFWDELFVFPVLNLRSPATTRSLLRYRYRRLPEARRAAREAGWVGAMFPWQSGSDGREDAQDVTGSVRALNLLVETVPREQRRERRIDVDEVLRCRSAIRERICPDLRGRCPGAGARAGAAVAEVA